MLLAPSDSILRKASGEAIQQSKVPQSSGRLLRPLWLRPAIWALEDVGNVDSGMPLSTAAATMPAIALTSSMPQSTGLHNAQGLLLRDRFEWPLRLLWAAIASSVPGPAITLASDADPKHDFLSCFGSVKRWFDPCHPHHAERSNESASRHRELGGHGWRHPTPTAGPASYG